jgi:hypothetical protein
LHFDGPFHYGMHFNRGNLFGKYITPLGGGGKLTQGSQEPKEALWYLAKIFSIVLKKNIILYMNQASFTLPSAYLNLSIRLFILTKRTVCAVQAMMPKTLHSKM